MHMMTRRHREPSNSRMSSPVTCARARPGSLLMAGVLLALVPSAGAYARCVAVSSAHVHRAVTSVVRPIVACAPAAVVAPPLESECGFDHQPLQAALERGDLLEADQITRDSLIKLGGEQAVRREFVYFTEVKKLPYKDMATIDALWRAYTNNKQGYSVQSKLLRSARIGNDLIKLYERIGWSKPGGTLLRWTAGNGNEFIYNNDEAPAGHLPLTSTLRGTRLLKELMAHPAIVDASQTLK